MWRCFGAFDLISDFGRIILISVRVQTPTLSSLPRAHRKSNYFGRFLNILPDRRLLSHASRIFGSTETNFTFTSHTATYPGASTGNDSDGCRPGGNTDQRRSQVYMIWESEGTFELMLCDRILSVHLEMTQAASLFQQS